MMPPYMPQDNQEKEYDLIVIGGGASGMMAAGVAAEAGKSVLIIEKNQELGKKLKITGGGRCNITNATFDTREFLKNFGDAGRFLFSPFSQFGVQDTFDFFEKKGLPLVVEANNRAFPHTHKATDVCKVMVDWLTENNVDSLFGCPVQKIEVDQNQEKITGVMTPRGLKTAHNYVLATGGASHQETGSTGDGFEWLRDIGHTAKEPAPNIVPLKVKEQWVKELSGKSLDDMKITFFVDEKKSFSERGRILFTHFGVSGPLILNSSYKVADLLHEGVVTAKIDCFPADDLGMLERKVLEVFDDHKNKAFKNVIKEIVPPGFSSAVLSFGVIADPEEKVHSISKEERKALVQLLKDLPFTILDLMSMDKAVISDGGIPLTEIDTKTMRSLKYHNFYLTGDILHINRPSGGYSLQLCWTTGFVVGKSV
jgi:predicted Rossmann fold flavoprotein